MEIQYSTPNSSMHFIWPLYPDALRHCRLRLSGNAVAVKYLLETGATVDSQGGLGQTARHIANRDGHKAVGEVTDAHEHGWPFTNSSAISDHIAQIYKSTLDMDPKLSFI